MTDKEAPKNIYLHNHDDAFNRAISYTPINDTSIKYVRADRYAALLDAAVSLEYWLCEIVHGAESSSICYDAQLALDKWSRFLNGKEE